MPPNSTELWQEGAAIESFKMVKEGVFDEDGLVDELYHKPSKYPGCSGTRTLRDNVADLKAAVAANNRGIHLIHALVREYTWPVVRFYMEAIQRNAEESVRSLLKGFARRFRGHPLEAVDWLDDGTPLALKVTIDGENGSARFDFTGTGPEAFNNLVRRPFSRRLGRGRLQTCPLGVNVDEQNADEQCIRIQMLTSLLAYRTLLPPSCFLVSSTAFGA
jgi:5-oxoprolinase (ATP-hydrolysing)